MDKHYWYEHELIALHDDFLNAIYDPVEIAGLTLAKSYTSTK